MIIPRFWKGCILFQVLGFLPIWKCQSSDLHKLQDSSQHICKILKLPRYKLQATSYRFFRPTGFPVWHFQPGFCEILWIKKQIGFGSLLSTRKRENNWQSIMKKTLVLTRGHYFYIFFLLFLFVFSFECKTHKWNFGVTSLKATVFL